jgi:UDP-2,3-diacylglucosamine pyrophosphatase LpxH
MPMPTSDHNLLIVSDLHLSEGFRPRTGKLSANEDFLCDDSFARFLEFQNSNRQQGRPWRLVIAGDAFDFLQVTTPSSRSADELKAKIMRLEGRTGTHPMRISDPQGRFAEAVRALDGTIMRLRASPAPGHQTLVPVAERLRLAGDGLHNDHVWLYEDLVLELRILELKSDGEQSTLWKDYGLGTSWCEAVWKMNRIAEGHSGFFSAVSWFIGEGNSVVMMKGNHDIELHWPQVQERIRVLLVDAHSRLSMGGPGTADPVAKKGADSGQIRVALRNRTTFAPWIYYEPGIVYIEHGNQYEVLDAFEDFLEPVLRKADEYLRLPPGSHFVRYFFNSIEKVFPFADNLRPISRSISWIFSKHFFTAVGLLMRHWKGAWLVVKMLLTRGGADARFTKGQERLRHRSRQAGDLQANQELEKLRHTDNAHALGLGASAVGPLTPDRLLAIEERARKQRSEKWAAVREWLTVFIPLGVLLLFIIGMALILLVPLRWASIATIAGTSPIESYFIRVPILGGAGFIVKSAIAALLRRITDVHDYLLTAARGVSTILRPSSEFGNTAEVPYLVFGHTHHPDMVQLEDGGPWYVNTGSWLSTISEVEAWSRLDQDFSFLEIVPGSLDHPPRLLRWNPDSQRPERIRLRDDESQKPRSA